MKKIVAPLIALTVLLSAVSCKKTEDAHEIPAPVPVYKEGVFHPVMKLASISDDGTVTQEWNWIGDNLDRITRNGTVLKTYSYEGDMIMRVSNNEGLGEELRYTYANGQMTKCELYYQDVLAVTVDLQHNAEGKLSGGTLTVDDDFLMTLAGELLGGGSFFEQLLGSSMAKNLVQFAKIADRAGDSKFSIGDKSFTLGFVWNGENVDKQIINGRFVVNVSSEDLEMVQNFMDIPEEYLSMIQMAMMLGGGTLPLQVDLADTITATYDEMYNPMFCNWGEIFSPQTLSRSNVLVMNNYFEVALSVSMMGQSMELLRRPTETLEEYTYQYNDKKYPVKVMGDSEIIYAYKN